MANTENAELKSEPQVRCDDLLAAARSLCEKIRLIHDDPLYRAVWICAWNHGVNYTHGPTYEHELKALEAAVKGAQRLR